MNALAKRAWSPWAVGAGIGALSCFTFLTAKKPLGITTPFEATAATLAQKTAPAALQVNRYLKEREEVPKLDWEWMLAAGVVVGSALSAAASGDQSRAVVPSSWARRFGPSPVKRLGAAFVGGALMMFGSRMAKGCTSGHGISGMLQLAGASWLFSPIMGASASLFARLLYKSGARHAG